MSNQQFIPGLNITSGLVDCHQSGDTLGQKLVLKLSWHSGQEWIDSLDCGHQLVLVGELVTKLWRLAVSDIEASFLEQRFELRVWISGVLVHGNVSLYILKQ